MKYCAKCGMQLPDEAIFCSRCGCSTNPYTYYPQPSQQQYPTQNQGMVTAAKVFMILGTILMALWTFFIGLAWCLPMTIIYFKKVNHGKPIGTGFKICSLLFVSFLAGILMLCDNSH